MALEEAASEIEESKIETLEEILGDEIKQEESEMEMSSKEQLESTENVNHVEVNMMQLLDSIASDTKEPVDTENTEVPENDMEKKENDEGVNEENTENMEGVEKDEPAINNEEESPSEVEAVPFENIKIKEEPLDIDEEPESEMFDFANVEVKKEPVDPESGVTLEHILDYYKRIISSYSNPSRKMCVTQT